MSLRSGNKKNLAAGGPSWAFGKAKFEIYGQEMIEKEVARSGKSGRVYVPLEWLGKSVKIIRMD